MKGNFHVQFLGEGVAATSPPYPTPGWATTPVYPAREAMSGFGVSSFFAEKRTDTNNPHLPGLDGGVRPCS